MNSTKYTACTGLMTMIRMVLGTAPINGPKNGMILVTPIMTEIRSAYDWSIVISPKPIRMRSPAKHSRPMMSESINLPVMNPPNTRWI